MPIPTLVSVGDNCLDVYVDEGGFTVGGNALNVAQHWVRAGGDGHYVGAVGDDAEGLAVVAGLGGLATARATVHTLSGRTGVTLLSDVDGDRHLLHEDFGVGLEFDLSGTELARARASDIVHVVGLHPRLDLTRRLVDAGATVSVDLSTSHDLSAVLGVAIAFASLDSPEPDAAEDYAGRLLDAGAKEAVVTRGAHGAVAMGPARTAVHVPALPTRLVDTCGAGDAFIAAYTLARASGEDLRAACLAGASLASSTCEHRGGWPQPFRPVTRTLVERAAAAGIRLATPSHHD